ncbi:MAG: hypothetical protein FJ306_14615, partial [Planctomycetes bacterium]|nr:hypothetical protein [Planctomycetota bacterium]
MVPRAAVATTAPSVKERRGARRPAAGPGTPAGALERPAAAGRREAAARTTLPQPAVRGADARGVRAAGHPAHFASARRCRRSPQRVDPSSMPDVLAELRARAAARRARIVLPETGDPRTAQARALLERDALCEVVWVDDPARDPRLPDVARLLHDRRKHKGLSEAQARELAAQPVMFGAGLVALGHAEAGVTGAAHATADVIRAGLFCLGTAPGMPLVSSMFLMARGDE